MTIGKLLAAHCQPLEGHAVMTTTDVAAQLALLPESSFGNGAIGRTFCFANRYETIAFVNALAFMVHREDHDPDLAVGYDRFDVCFSTHSVDGISANDFICAATTDAVFAQRCNGAPA